MKKKLSAYLSLFVMLSSFLTGPISVYAETINPEEKTTQTTDSQKENQETDVTNEDNKNGEEVQQSESSTTTTTEEPTKVPIIAGMNIFKLIKERSWLAKLVFTEV